MSAKTLSAYERWTWGNCRERILSLKRRLGYGERLWILGFEVHDDGRLNDPFHGVEVFNPTQAGPATTIPSRYSAVPEMYCLLSTYAAADEIPLTGDPLALSEIDPIRRARLTTAECDALLAYAEQDWPGLRNRAVPFFGEKLAEGDLGFQVWPLPRIPISLLLWQADDEFPAGGTLLYDRSAPHYLPDLLEELAGLTVWRLRNLLDPEVKWGYHEKARQEAARRTQRAHGRRSWRRRPRRARFPY